VCAVVVVAKLAKRFLLLVDLLYFLLMGRDLFLLLGKNFFCCCNFTEFLWRDVVVRKKVVQQQEF
jgi:hypothetical protein